MFILDTIFWYGLVVTGIVFLISGLDDLFFDIVYWSYYFYQRIKEKDKNILKYKELSAIPEKRIAMIVGCWHEYGVIEPMVHYNLYNIDYVNFDIFIGVYPNDEETVSEAKNVEAEFRNVHCVVNPKNGPTNKADNLNSIYKYIIEFEKKHNTKFDILVIHDPEDVIHFLSFKVLNYLIPKAPMVQIPIFPLEMDLDQYVYWSYCDEFSELHTKDLVVREIVNGFIPSAGVGTGFDRDVLEIMARDKNGVPFGTATFTEDYSTSLQLHRLKMKEKWKKKPVFSIQYVERVQVSRPWYYFGIRRLKTTRTLVATRALFPQSYRAAVRQRSRWTLGIVFQEWKNSGWKGKFSTVYFIFHDRKAIIAHFCGGFAYIIFLYWLGVFIYSHFIYYTVTLEYFLQKNTWFWVIISLVTLMMINRMLQRMIATYRIYGIFPALVAPFRIFVSNFINMHSFIKAFRQHFAAIKEPKKSVWVKTQNNFPVKEKLISQRRRLGDVLVERDYISISTLLSLLEEQKITKEKLGQMLIRKKLISVDDLLMVLSKLNNIESRVIKENDILKSTDISGLSHDHYQWLIDHNFRPIGFSEKEGILSLGITNPEEDLNLSKAIFEKITPLKAKFYLVQWGAPKQRKSGA